MAPWLHQSWRTGTLQKGPKFTFFDQFFFEDQILPVAQHGMEEATYNSEPLAAEEIVDWAASLSPAPHVIHIDLRTPTCNSYLWGNAWATELWRELRRTSAPGPTVKI